MRRNIGFVAMAAVGLGLASLAGSAAAGEPLREIEEMEQKWAEAVEHNDPDEIGNFLSADFTFVNPRGVLLPRAQHLDDFRQKRTVFKKVELTDVVIRVYGDAAVVTSRPKITGFALTPAGKTTFDAQPARFTDTLIRVDGKWKSVARQMSLASG
jgi:ketosteroid isomerase-like protein